MSDLPVWLQITESISRTLVPFVAVVGAIVAYLSYRQHRLADNRAEWWRRVSNAIDLCATPKGQIGRSTGMQLLTEMLNDHTATAEDAAMLASLVDALIDEIVDADE